MLQASLLSTLTRLLCFEHQFRWDVDLPYTIKLATCYDLFLMRHGRRTLHTPSGPFSQTRASSQKTTPHHLSATNNNHTWHSPPQQLYRTSKIRWVGPTGWGVTNRLLTISHIVCSPALPHGHIPRSLSRVSKWTNGHVTVHVPGIHGKGERFVFPGPNILPNTISTPNPRRRETRCWLATCGSCYLYLHLLSLQLLFYFGFLVHECVYSSV